MLKSILSFLLLLLQLQMFAQGATELKPWLPKLEAEYQGVYHFGESENEWDLILICSTNKWYAQLASGSFNADGTKWIKHFENLNEIKISNNSFQSNKYKGEFVRYANAEQTTKALVLNEQSENLVGDKTQNLQNYFLGKYPQSSFKILSLDELITFSKQDLKVMRNEIYARYGYKFKSGGEMDTYFKKQDWYTPQHENVDAFLTEIEKANSELILKAEQSK